MAEGGHQPRSFLHYNAASPPPSSYPRHSYQQPSASLNQPTYASAASPYQQPAHATLSSVSSVSSPMSSSAASPTSATSAVSAIDDILNSFSSNSRPSYHSTPPSSSPPSNSSSPTPLPSLLSLQQQQHLHQQQQHERHQHPQHQQQQQQQQQQPQQHADNAMRQREPSKLASVVASIRNCRTAADLSSLLTVVFLQTQPQAFFDIARYFVAVDGLSTLVDWLEKAYAATLRDATHPAQLPPLPPQQSTDAAVIPPQMVEPLLVMLLQSMYRLAVYQRAETRAAMPRRPSLLPLLHALLTYQRDEVRELSLRLFEHYQVLFGGADVVHPSVLPTGGGSAQQPLSVTGAMRLEFELFVASEQQKSLLLMQQHAAAAQQQLSAHSTHHQQQQQQQQPQHAAYSHGLDISASLGPPLYTNTDRAMSPSLFLSVSPIPPTTERSPSPIRLGSSPVQPLTTNGFTAADSAATTHVQHEFVQHEHNDSNSSVADLMTFPLPVHAPSTVPASTSVTASPQPPASPDRMITVSASLMCPVCEHVSTSDMTNYQHVLSTHHRLLCVACALTFDNEDALYSHFEAHPSNDTDAASSYACGLCGLSFTTEEALSLHHSVHVMDRKGKERQQLIIKKKKRKLAAEEKDNKEAGGGSPSKKSKRDKSGNGGGGDDEDEEDAADDEGGGGPGARFPPAVCSHPSHPTPISFACDEDLQSHSGPAHSIYYCYAIDCGAKLHTGDELADHLRSHVQAAVLAGGGSATASLPSHCVYCGVVWSKKVTKTEHMHRHDKPFRCSFCPMRFARRTRWRAHIKRKHPQEWAEHTPLLETSK